jgi:mRNA interferase RelE/StbE
MPSWRIVLTRSFEKDFRALPHDIRERVLEVLEEMQSDPFTGKKLLGVKIGVYRLRVGDYRIRYDIIRKDVVLYRVRHRKEVYER